MPDSLVSLVAPAIVVMGTVGVSALVWGVAGLARIIARRTAPAPVGRIPTPDDVAVIIAAHNEELVIRDTLASAASQVSLENIFVASDGSSDATVALCHEFGVGVVDIFPNRGKAGAIVEALDAFEVRQRFEVILLLDADTRLRPDYLETGLPLFGDADVVAVAGRATTSRDPRPETWLGRFLTDYRERLYVSVQYLQKFGQAGRRANAVAIVPGFASMYRTRILDRVVIDVPGLAIEDYNMTLEVHDQKLGRIAFDPACAIAETQDPVHFGEYTKQIRRWSLGFWQTVRRHGPHRGLFWTALGVFIAEVVVSSVVLIVVLPLTSFALVVWLINIVWPGDGALVSFAHGMMTVLPPIGILAALVIPDLMITAVAAILSRRWPHPAFLLYPFMRIVDAVMCMIALGETFFRTSDGRWSSPSRRASSTSQPTASVD